MNTTEQAAYDMGADAAKAAASWIVDGNTDAAAIRRTLAMMEDGDLAVWDYLPAYPNLSGEMADDPTPRSLAAALGLEDCGGDELDALCDAYEAGVADTFETACERELHSWLPTETESETA